MKFSKNIFTALLMLLFAATASAQSLKITIDPVTIAVGEEAQIVMNYETETAMRAGQFEIFLPEGLSFVELDVEEGEEPEIDIVKGDALTSKHDISYKKRDDAGKHYAFLIGGLTKNSLKTSGSLMTIKVVADEALAESSEIAVKNIKFSATSESATAEDFTVAVTMGTPTAISGIEANSKNAASYNLGGVKFGTKGLRIMKGKKFVQK